MGIGGLLLLIMVFRPVDTTRLRARAEAAAHGGDWKKALESWRLINATAQATATTHLGEARACLAMGRAAEAERALRRAVAVPPGERDALLLLLEILRVEDRPLEALRLGWDALDQQADPEPDPETRRSLLRELTLAVLADVPDNLARTTLRRWIDADPSDVDAQVALLQRIGAEPRSDDPDRPARLASLEKLLAVHPGHVGVREALVSGLADAGEPDRGRALLEAWPSDARDARYWRLKGRWDLEYDRRPDQAVTAFRTALDVLPQDWRTHYRLARALKILGRTDEARAEAETVGRIREALDPATLGPRLDAALAHLDDPSAVLTLADLCARAGLHRLARAWRGLGATVVPADQNGGRLNPAGSPPLNPLSR